MSATLKLRFEDPEAFAAEYATNIAQGGAFVVTSTPLQLRQPVVVELELTWCGERARLDAEVVHVVSEEEAGEGAGVAVQFHRPAATLRERFERFLPPRTADTAADPVEHIGEEFGTPGQDFSEDAEFEIESPLGQSGDESGQDDSDSSNRRHAERRSARVPAQVRSTHVVLDGRTRDISESGALLSVDASDVPLGKNVCITLQHPETGERVEVNGLVARHVEGEGTVAAVAVEFDDAGREALSRFVNDAHASEEERCAGGVSGAIEELGITNLIQMFGMSSPSGTLTVTAGEEEGVIAFEGGLLRYSRLGSLRGGKALSRMLGWSQGRFQFHSRVDALDDEDDPVPLDGVLLEAVRQFDEAQRVAGSREIDPGAQLSLDLDAFGAESEPLEKTEQAVVDLAAANLTVRRLLDVIPEPDAVVLAAIQGLLERGIVSLN